MSKELAPNKTKIHTLYENSVGERLPSVTTILGELAKPALIHWAWDLGTRGINYKTFRDDLAEVGSLVHRMILAYIKGEKMNLDEYSPAVIDRAENCLISYFEWEKHHKIEPVIVEQPLISEQYGYGGTPDFCGKIDGVMTLMDYKSSKAIYDEHFYQLAAYRQLVVEHGIEDICSFRVLRIGREESEGFEEQQRPSLSLEWDVFRNALGIWKAKAKIKARRSEPC